MTFKNRLVLAAFAAVVVVGCIIAWQRTPETKLSPLRDYKQLPAVFQQELQRAYTDARHAKPESLRKLARLYLANGLLPEAKECFGAINKSTGGLTAQDHYYLAYLAQSEGDLERAKSELQATLRLDPHYLPARLMLGETLYKSGKADEAAQCYTDVLQVEAQQPQAVLGLARVELQRGNDEAAIKRLEGVLAVHSDATSAAALLAQVLSRLGEKERAAALTEWSHQKHEPVTADPWLDALLVDCYDLQRLSLKFEEYANAGQMDLALPFLARVEQLDPGSWIPPMLKGWSKARAKQPHEAVDLFKQSLERGGDAERLVPLVVNALIALDDLKGAETFLSQYRVKSPESIAVLTASSDVAVRQGNQSLAKELLKRVLEKEPYLYVQNMALAKILWTEGDRAGAVKCLSRVEKVFPDDVASRGLLAQYYLERGDSLSALDPLEGALAHSPADSPAAVRIRAMLVDASLKAANLRAEGGDVEGSLKAVERAIVLAPGEPAPLAAKAEIAVRVGEMAAATDALRQLVKLQPENPTIYLSLGDVLYQTGDVAHARENWLLASRFAAASDTALRSAIAARLSGHAEVDTSK